MHRKSFEGKINTMPRITLEQILKDHGFPTELITLIRATLEGSKPSEWLADKVMSCFVILDELKKGDAV